MKYFDTAFRVFFCCFMIGGYLAMVVFRGMFMEQAACWKKVSAVAGLIVYIVALGAVMMAHANGRRPFWELPLAFAAPYLLYAALFLSFDWQSGELWRFTGAFQFISIAGGFFLGIVLSPFIAVVTRSVTGREALDFTVFGFRFIDAIGLKAFGVVLALGLVAALFYFTRALVFEAREIGVVRKIVFYILLLNAVSLFTYYTYTLTRFGSGMKT